MRQIEQSEVSGKVLITKFFKVLTSGTLMNLYFFFRGFKKDVFVSRPTIDSESNMKKKMIFHHVPRLAIR